MTPSHTQSDIAGIVKSRPPVVQLEFDPLAFFMDALDELVEFAQDDAVSACESLPGGRGLRGPNVAGLDDRYAKVVAELQKLLAPAVSPAADTSVDNVPDLTIVRNPDLRVAMPETAV